MRRTVVLLLLCAVARADRDADLACAHAIREFNMILIGNGGSIASVKSAIVANLKNASAKVAKSIRFQLDRGYKKKYNLDAEHWKAISTMLASGGKAGISKLYKRYKGESKRHALRKGIAEALGECGDKQALDTLLKLIHDKQPEVAAAAIKGCASYPGVKGDAVIGSDVCWLPVKSRSPLSCLSGPR